MSSDRTVEPKDLLDALMELRRAGPTAVLRRLEQEEPDLAEFVMEETTAVHTAVGTTGARASVVRRVSRRVEALVLTAVLAMRAAHLRLWSDGAGRGVAERLGASGEPSEPASEAGRGAEDVDRMNGGPGHG